MAFLANFDVHSGLLTDTKPGDDQVSIQHCLDLIQRQNVISGHPAEAAQIPKSGEGLGTSNPATRGTPPLKSPRCVSFSPQAWRKTGGFLRFFVFFNLTQFHHILHTFAQVMAELWCLKQMLLIMTPKGVKGLSENGRNDVLIVSERGESSHLNYVYPAGIDHFGS